MFERFRAFAQTTTYLGVAVIASIWCGAYYFADEGHQRASENAVQQGGNLARVFEAYISRVIGGADSALLALRELYQRDPQHFDIEHLVSLTRFQNNVITQFGIVGPDGLIKLSSVRSIVRDETVRDRDYFRFQADASTDELYIDAPVEVGRVTGRRMFHLVRRLTATDGSFGGVIVASIDIQPLENFYSLINIGDGGVIALVGFDGIIRVRSGRDPAARDVVGESAAKTPIFSLFRQSTTGNYWNDKTPFDGVKRLISYQVVEGFPLIATIGLAEDDIFAESRLIAQKYYAVAFVLTLIVIGTIGVGASRQRKLYSTVATLGQTNLWFDTALENMAHGLSMFDKNQRLVVCNERYREMYGLTSDQIKTGTPLRRVLEACVAVGNSPANAAAYVEERVRDLGGTEPSYVENELRNGKIFAINNQPMPGGGWVAIHQDITERKRSETQIAYMAHHDSLTGIANRAVLLQKIEEALASLQQRGEAFTIFMLDLDLFKTINDSLGHPVGDELLKAVARRLSACTRETDTVARLGGDEFAILAAVDGDQRETAIVTSNGLLEALAAPYAIDGHLIEIGTSIGIALAPEHSTDVDQLVKSADLALYKAKAEGRDRYCFFEDAMGIEAHSRRVLQIDLRNALTNDEFELHYHPIVDIKSGEVASVEALVRWRHPRRGMIAPGDFIPLAEETGLINAIGEWVLRKACSDAVGWPSHIKVSVNLSPVQFRKVSPIEMLRKSLSDSALPPDRLEVEITESVLLQSDAKNVEILHQLRLMGISIVLDDFGTGYSSLSYLRMFPFDKIKIDRSFVHELSKNADCASIVSAVANLGRNLRIATVAEGIETEDQRVLVRAAGCTHAQGFLFGQPCPADELSFQTFRERKPRIIAS